MSRSFRIIVLLILFTPTVVANNSNSLVSEKGILDLRELEFDQSTVINLNGEWEFYWKKNLYPVDFDSDKQLTPDCYGKVPSYWTSYNPDNCDIESQGYATYRLKILLPPSFREEIMFDVPVFDAAFDLYIDNLLYWGGSQGDQIRNNPDSCNISGIVSEVFNVFKEMASQKSISLETGTTFSISLPGISTVS